MNVVPLSDRRDKLANLPTVRTLRVRFQGTSKDLAVKQIPLDLPIYRMANMRTSVRQRQHVRREHKSEDWFNAGQEDPEAQGVQHGFLLELSHEKTADIYARLAEEAEHSEALIVTKDGVVVNGNRRLAAMRDLYSKKSAQYRRFESVEVAVLPKADESDLAGLETDLQIAEDLRLDYGWIERALGLRHQTSDLEWDIDRAASHWGKKRDELQALLSQLSLAEEYLAWLGEPEDYEQVEDDEQAFATLQARLQGQAGGDPAALEAQRLMTFAVIKSNGDERIGGRIYDYVSKIKEIQPKVVRALQQATISEPDVSTPYAAPAADDPLASLPETPQAVPERFLEVLRDQDNALNVALIVVAAKAEIDEHKRISKHTNALLKAAETINSTATSSLVLRNADPATYPRVIAQLVGALKPIVDCIQQVLKEKPELQSNLDVARIKEVERALSNLDHSSEA